MPGKPIGNVRNVSGPVKDPYAQNPGTRTVPGLQGAIEKRMAPTPSGPARPTPSGPPTSATPVANVPGKTLAPRPAGNIPAPVLSNTPSRGAISRRMKKPVIR